MWWYNSCYFLRALISPLAWPDLQACWFPVGIICPPISSCSLVTPLFFDINAKRTRCCQWATPFVFKQISSANLMGFISVFTDDWFVKGTVPQRVVVVHLRCLLLAFSKSHCITLHALNAHVICTCSINKNHKWKTERNTDVTQSGPQTELCYFPP